jgi:hypothetical protein
MRELRAQNFVDSGVVDAEGDARIQNSINSGQLGDFVIADERS